LCVARTAAGFHVRLEPVERGSDPGSVALRKGAGLDVAGKLHVDGGAQGCWVARPFLRSAATRRFREVFDLGLDPACGFDEHAAAGERAGQLILHAADAA
jgi:hypothetical protein